MNIERKINLRRNSRFLKFTKRFVLFLICILIFGYSYQKVGIYLDNKKYSPPGQLVKVNGQDMHVFSKGTGKQTVIFASGNGVSCPYVNFYPLYSEVSKYAKVVVYDRPGTGWSQSTKSSRDIDTIVDEIHIVLEKSGQKPPYIFVSHSLGSLETIRFTQKYKGEVKGIVFIDSGNPEFYKDNPLPSANYGTTKLLKNFGVLRVLFQTTNMYKTLSADKNGMNLIPKDLQKLDMAMTLKNIVNDDGLNELKNSTINAKTVLKNGKLGNIPIRIFTSQGNSTMSPAWAKSQIEFKNWSSDSRQTIVSGSKHYIHLYSPQIINKSIIDLINYK
ncbi:alpha/beta hydrolase [Clostridium autoethanogenum]|uniref:Alpha/beta hydrolase n=1 Tax=Clostridium autoethanogenum TaxID=84023 RepID=A0A3M0S6H1_9CLOT|nr:alpha/beta hydrolase [Clostridium autoethanogenum]RMC93973.1 alpha/beta hydrolase [Clostridium autoethanogenum]